MSQKSQQSFIFLTSFVFIYRNIQSSKQHINNNAIWWYSTRVYEIYVVGQLTLFAKHLRKIFKFSISLSHIGPYCSFVVINIPKFIYIYICKNLKSSHPKKALCTLAALDCDTLTPQTPTERCTKQTSRRRGLTLWYIITWAVQVCTVYSAVQFGLQCVVQCVGQCVVQYVVQYEVQYVVHYVVQCAVQRA